MTKAVSYHFVPITLLLGRSKMDKYSMCRPGGFNITERAIKFCNLKEDSKIVDIGCGTGATVYYISEKYGYNICGLDKDEKSINTAKSFGKSKLFHLGDAKNLPFETSSLDALLFECSFSKMDEPKLVLEEGKRVLKNNGYLIMSDFYARKKAAKLQGLLGRLDKKEDIINQIEEHNFTIKLFEDYSDYMVNMWGQMIFEQGLDKICKNIGADTEELKEIKSGYFLLIAQKTVK